MPEALKPGGLQAQLLLTLRLAILPLSQVLVKSLLKQLSDRQAGMHYPRWPCFSVYINDQAQDRPSRIEDLHALRERASVG